MKPLRAVIFDMDGVLVASGQAHRASWKTVARQRGLEITDEAFDQTFGRTSRDIIRMLWGADLSEEALREIDAEKELAYRQLVTGMVPLTIGAREVLSELTAAGLKLAVATSGPPENVDLVLDEARLRPFFQAIVTGVDVRHGKPAPDCFLLAAARLSVPPAECIVVEDALHGIAAASAAGMASIGYTSTHPVEALRASGAEHAVTSLPELVPLILARC